MLFIETKQLNLVGFVLSFLLETTGAARNLILLSLQVYFLGRKAVGELILEAGRESDRVAAGRIAATE